MTTSSPLLSCLSFPWEWPQCFTLLTKSHLRGLPWWISGKKPTRLYRRQEFDPWSGKTLHAARTTKPLHQNYWVHALEPREPWLLKPVHPWAWAPPQEKPLQWEGHVLLLESIPPFAITRKRPSTAKKLNK